MSSSRAPAISSAVGSMSVMWKRPSYVVPRREASIAGECTNAGTRTPPSKVVNLEPRSG